MQAHRDVLIAIVDDDDSFRIAMEGLIGSLGYRAAGYAAAELFLGSETGRDADCIISHIQMPGMSGMEMKRRLDAEGRNMAVIFVTAHTDAALYRQAMECGAAALLHKPFEGQLLIDKLHGALGL